MIPGREKALMKAVDAALEVWAIIPEVNPALSRAMAQLEMAWRVAKGDFDEESIVIRESANAKGNHVR